ncbi:MAG: hypothetical protein M1828_000108 [Chrysothrix sp. TS-e1954]|nr:MAG: hypothetical protein M1828_000108 [Chrysothrix sp. TS-e1954]
MEILARRTSIGLSNCDPSTKTFRESVINLILPQLSRARIDIQREYDRGVVLLDFAYGDSEHVRSSSKTFTKSLDSAKLMRTSPGVAHSELVEQVDVAIAAQALWWKLQEVRARPTDEVQLRELANSFDTCRIRTITALCLLYHPLATWIDPPPVQDVNELEDCPTSIDGASNAESPEFQQPSRRAFARHNLTFRLTHDSASFRSTDAPDSIPSM